MLCILVLFPAEAITYHGNESRVIGAAIVYDVSKPDTMKSIVKVRQLESQYSLARSV